MVHSPCLIAPEARSGLGLVLRNAFCATGCAQGGSDPRSDMSHDMRNGVALGRLCRPKSGVAPALSVVFSGLFPVRWPTVKSRSGKALARFTGGTESGF